MRIALLCPYSWTYPGGVTRHIEALAGELLAAGHDVKVLAPFDPDDSTSRRLHRGASPERRAAPDHLVSLGRTIGLPANGAVSNLALFPESVAKLRQELRSGRYDVAHVHEPVVPLVCWDALCCAQGLPLVGTFHTYSDNALSNGAARMLGATRRMNRLHARIAVSEAAAWTARRFFGGRYRVIPNGVRLVLPPASLAGASTRLPAGGGREALRIIFIGQAVERKGLPVLLQAFEALREHVPATLTLVGASREEVAPLLLDDRGVTALGKVSEQEKLAALADADVLCAPSLRGESFGMVLTEAFASGAPVVASDITGYRDVVRDRVDGLLVRPGDPLALAEALRELALQPRERASMARAARERAQRFAWPAVAAEVLDAYRDAVALAGSLSRGAASSQGSPRVPERALATGATRTRTFPPPRLRRLAVGLGVASVDGLPRVPPRRIASLEPRPQRSLARRCLRIVARAMLAASAAAGVGVVLLRIGLAPVIASLVASRPGLLAAGLGLMCAAMVGRALAWHSILATASTWRRARLSDALQGTFIGVLMSATLPVRLGETSRALIVARRLGRARESLPVVLGTIVSQSLLNLLALGVLGACGLLSLDLASAHGILVALALAPIVALAVALAVALLAPALLMAGPDPGAGARWRRLLFGLGLVMDRLRAGLELFRHPREAVVATVLQMAAWALQWLACWVLAMALGLGEEVSLGAAAAVLFAVNVTGVVPATPGNVVVFQAACVAVLTGAYHVAGAEALAYGIVLQLVELAAATAMGMPALIAEGLSWREVRLRTVHAMPVSLRPRSERGNTAADSRLRS
ncbi:MAG: glycosyltransferase [Solirubrobacteraceae bacterium]